MMKDYKELYFEDSVNTVASIFNYVLYDVELPLDLFTNFFINSEEFKKIEMCHPYYVGGRSGVEIAKEMLSKNFIDLDLPEPSLTENKNRYYWAGWALANYQLTSDISYKEIVSRIPLEEIINMYDVFHEMDISRFCDAMNKKYISRQKETKLKLLRTKAGLSQSELAKKSGVSLRLIQLYEQRANDINKGQFLTVMKLAQALNCDASDLKEW